MNCPRSLWVPEEESLPEVLRTETAEEFLDGLSLFAARIRPEFSAQFSVSKHRSIYLTVRLGAQLVFLARLSTHEVPPHQTRRANFDLVFHHHFQSENENDEAIATLEKTLADFL